MIINHRDPIIVKLETGLTIFYLLYLTTSFSISGSNIILDTFMSRFAYLITFILVFPRTKKIIYALSKDPFLVFLIALSAISFLWSVEPETSLRMGIGIIRISLFGAYLAVRYSIQDLLKIIASVLGVAAILSFFTVFALPGEGINISDGAWVGIYRHKNLLGRRMAFGAILFFFWALGSRNWKFQWSLWSLSGLSSFLVLMSQSFASFILLGSFIPLLPFYKTTKNNSKVTLKVAIFSLLLFLSFLFTSIILENLASIFSFFGKDLSLTGRVPIWQGMLEISADRPLLGYGIGNAMWEIPALVARTNQDWNAPDSHNGFLELLVGLGLIGLILFILSYLNTLVKAIAQLRKTRNVQDIWLIQYLIILVLMNFSEDELLKASNTWMYYVIVAISTTMLNIRNRDDADNANQYLNNAHKNRLFFPP